MIFENNERVKVVALKNQMLPKRLLGSVGHIAEKAKSNPDPRFGTAPLYWVRLDNDAGYFCASFEELESVFVEAS